MTYNSVVEITKLFNCDIVRCISPLKQYVLQGCLSINKLKA